jgi:DNA polymerase III delta prime subunit
MIGQESLIKELKSYNILTFPQTLMLVGERGCGKHLLISEVISPHLKLDVIDITNNISYDTIAEVYIKAVPAIYLINASSLSIKNQNSILKFIEEPVSNSFIIILSEDTGFLLDTVVNRCSVYYFEPYTPQQLLSFFDYKKQENKSLAIKLLKTPGQLISTPETSLENMHTLCKRIALELEGASLPRTLTISNAINYGNDGTKFDMYTFFKCLTHVFLDNYISTKKNVYFNLYNKTADLLKKIYNPKLNKQSFVENFLLNIWSISKG